MNTRTLFCVGPNLHVVPKPEHFDGWLTELARQERDARDAALAREAAAFAQQADRIARRMASHDPLTRRAAQAQWDELLQGGK